METPTYKFALRKDLEGEEKIEFLPTRAEPKASGWDVRAAQEDRKPIVLAPFEYAKIPLGFRSFCPKGYWWELKPRSSTFAKKNLHCLYGTIDEEYEGDLVLAVQYIPRLLSDDCIGDSMGRRYIQAIRGMECIINFGDAIGQIVPVKRQEMQAEQITNADYDALCKERGGVRGEGGFGSTSK
jgi:dUTPase